MIDETDNVGQDITEEEAQLRDIANQLATIKCKESGIKAQRIDLENQIAALVETGENGSKTVSAGSGLKVTVKRALGYSADVSALKNLALPTDQIPLKFVPESYAFDPKAYEKLVEENPSVATRVSEFVTATPKKVNVTIKIG